ncbi:fam-a protein, partial [Plasmodium berghei]
MFIFINDSSEEIFKQNKHLLPTNPDESRKACKFMNDALKQLEHHATSKGHTNCGGIPSENIVFYKKNIKYNELLNELWDPDSNQYINKAYILIISMQFYNMFLEKIVRVYSPNLVMIQQRCKKLPWSRQKYFYAIAAKFKISENKTIFVMASANINDL